MAKISGCSTTSSGGEPTPREDKGLEDVLLEKAGIDTSRSDPNNNDSHVITVPRERGRTSQRRNEDDEDDDDDDGLKQEGKPGAVAIPRIQYMSQLGGKEAGVNEEEQL